MENSYFLDSDVILDYLLDRMPFADSSQEIFTLAMNSKINLFISSLSISNVDYLLKKKVGRIISLQMIKDFCTICGILSVGEKEILQAFKSNFKDFEDSIQHQTALGNPEIKAIITRNVADYKKSQIPVFSPEIFLSRFK
ncbi:type II toxin-antitoxin system VapC family toxin [Algoriphagus hitonicola]|uniref:PIN domain-containing protein n=1 Tax=Algoriphagus hitonicola TaxID=435880 RepID=A0A1I2UU59_9BACT|nr:PIN domain-containing protein [Algoriphagus hitonicola]SFG80560.1 hypothetical protein SAMN04487988_108135 [Algoriphagus hitonicola]